MPVTAAGNLSLAQECLRTTLADATAFRTFAGAADRAAALLRIHHDVLPPPAAAAPAYTLAEWAAHRPYAIVAGEQTGGYSVRHATGGASFGFEESGHLWLLLGAAPDSDYTADADQDAAFRNAVGEIIGGLMDLAGLAGYLAIETIAVAAIGRNLPDDAPGCGEEMLCILGITWGTAQ